MIDSEAQLNALSRRCKQRYHPLEVIEEELAAATAAVQATRDAKALLTHCFCTLN